MIRATIFGVLMVSVLSISITAQELALRVSFVSPKIERSAKKVMVTVTITNRSEAVFNTKKLESVSFGFFRNTPVRGYNHRRGDEYSSGADVKKAKLNKGESVSFDINLAKLIWLDSSVSIVPLPMGQGPGLPIIPNYMKYFAAWVQPPLPKPKTKKERRTQIAPPSSTIYSNEVEVEIVPK